MTHMFSPLPGFHLRAQGPGSVGCLGALAGLAVMAAVLTAFFAVVFYAFRAIG